MINNKISKDKKYFINKISDKQFNKINKDLNLNIKEIRKKSYNNKDIFKL